MKRVALVVAGLCVSLCAHAGDLPKDTAVRVEGLGIEGGWFEGKIFLTSEGCTMVKLERPTKDKYTALALTSVAQIHKKEASGWKALSVEALKSHEPKHCLVEGSD